MNKIIASGWIALVLAACTPGDSLPGLLEVSAEIAQSKTRAADEHASDYDKRSFSTGDLIQISKDNGTPVQYQRKAAGDWELASGQTALTTVGTETFVASFPAGFTGILSNQTSATNFWSSNQLQATGVLNGNKGSFTFAPVAAKVTVVVTYGSAQTPSSASLTGTGIRTNASGSETIQPYCSSGSGTSAKRHTYVAIVYPGSRQFTISIKTTTETEKSYTDASPFTLKAGYNYQYNFTSTNELILTGLNVNIFTETMEENVGSAT